MNQFHPTRILVPTDFSEASTAALREGVLLAERSGGVVDVVCADLLLPEVDVEDIFGRHGGVDPTALRQAEERLQNYVLAHVPSHVRGGSLFVVDSPVHAITEASRELQSDLIIMATHGRTGLPRFFLGSVCELVIREADIPVLSLPIRKMREADRHPHHTRKILCPINYSSVAMRALEHAGSLAELFDAELLVLDVVDPRDHTHSVGELYRLKSWVPAELHARCDYKQIELAFDSAEQLISFAAQSECDLIVIGAEHNRRSDESVVGATAERLTRLSDMAVLTVMEPRHGRGRQREAASTPGKDRQTQLIDRVPDAHFAHAAGEAPPSHWTPPASTSCSTASSSEEHYNENVRTETPAGCNRLQ
jgi:nucleotide-binding universal stress UspA family protein